ncbi:MAG: hypothetical protein AAF532_10780 [Planctomycetota bacterium]
MNTATVSQHMVPAVYMQHGVGESIELYRGQARLHSGNAELHGKVVIQMSFASVNETEVVMEVSPAPPSIHGVLRRLSDRPRCEVADINLDFDCLLINTEWSMSNRLVLTLTSVSFVSVGSWSSRCREVRSHYFNVPRLVLTPSRYRLETGDAIRGVECIEGDVGDWRVVFEMIETPRGLYRSLANSKGYFLTAVLALTRCDGRGFWASDAESVLDVIDASLSFAFHRNVRRSLVVNFGFAGQVIAEEWGAMRIDGYRSLQGWFDYRRSASLLSLWKRLFGVWEDPRIRDLFEESLYWYVDGHSSGGAIEKTLVMLSTCLEMLAWRLCVKDDESSKLFGGFSSVKRIRKLFVELRVGTVVPSHLESIGLVSLALREAKLPCDLPAVIGRVRNLIVHSSSQTRSSDTFKFTRSADVLWEIVQVQRFVIECALLKQVGFAEVFGDRTRPKQYSHTAVRFVRDGWPKEERSAGSRT